MNGERWLDPVEWGRGGANLVLGRRPHVLQGWRRAGRCLTLFSLGDEAFDACAGGFEARVASATRRERAVFTVRVAGEPGLDVLPLTLDADGWPRTPDEIRGRAQVERLTGLAAGLMGDAREHFAREAAPRLPRCEIGSLGHCLRQGRWNRTVWPLGSVRPRHLPLRWQALRRRRRDT